MTYRQDVAGDGVSVSHVLPKLSRLFGPPVNFPYLRLFFFGADARAYKANKAALCCEFASGAEGQLP